MTAGASSSNLVTKTCSKCGLAADQFKGNQCIECVRKYARERARRIRAADPEKSRQYLRDYWRDNPERVKAWTDRYQFAAFGLTRASYEAMLEAQDGRCAICRRASPGGKGRWHIDHDHSCCGPRKACGECIRGLLCFSCNAALGYMRDSPATLIAAADYLISHERLESIR